ncbi:hypothetical protein [Haloarcula laminariae]|uniref:hypothetical protein n=1 Tax=Haloarcula laminariae TaxID=2961577 RepID=UPI002405C54F|nr:hypothetical protein [Halomicroarcula sp. FL173]
MSDIGKKLEETPPEVLRAFLAREFAADPDLERRFHSFLDTSDLDVYRRSRPSASGLDPEGEGRKLR